MTVNFKNKPQTGPPRKKSEILLTLFRLGEEPFDATGRLARIEGEMTADDDRISQALGPDWTQFLAIVHRWYDENSYRLQQGWDIPIDDETLLSFELGVYLHEPGEDFSPYDATPQNSFTFARTGGDGEHYSVLLDPPARGVVVLTAPMAFDQPNTVVGESLGDVLSLASTCGLSMLANLAYLGCAQAETLIREAKPSAIFTALENGLGLAPWPDICGRLDGLARRYGASVVPHGRASTP